MLKFIIILFLFVYIISKLFGSVFGFLFSQADRRGQTFKDNRRNTSYHHQPKDGNVRVDYVPEKQKKNKPKTNRSGEYIDFEEVD